MATMRLVSSAGTGNGHFEAAVDITMTPGSHTYWKVPGEAGVPPVFSFNGSTNVKTAEVRYPVPLRITEEGLDAFGYLDRVVFPVDVVADDPGKPSELHVDVTYAVCNRICLPGHSDAVLELRPNGKGTAPAIVAAALKKVPEASPATKLSIERVEKAEMPTWTLKWTGSPPLTDIFAAAPEGFYFSTKKIGADSWRLKAEQIVAAPQDTKVNVALVLAKPDGSIQTERTFSFPLDNQPKSNVEQQMKDMRK